MFMYGKNQSTNIYCTPIICRLVSHASGESEELYDTASALSEPLLSWGGKNSIIQKQAG